MSIFLDTGPVVAYRNERDADHQRADELLTEVMVGAYGRAFTSQFIFDEAVTLALVRTKNLGAAVAVGELLLPANPEERFVTVLPVVEAVFDTAWKRFQNQGDRRLSFTDWTSAVLVEQHGIDAILSFDGGFDGLVGRLS
jgi:predicted nucleic acid-binding protein